MYNNIGTALCIACITKYLKRPSTKQSFPHYNTSALVEALTLVMQNNCMRFSNLLVKQLKGIAMGMSPAPTITNLFVAIHEATDILQFLDTSIFWLKRFIDDGFGVWLHDKDPVIDAANWESFQVAINSGGLQ